MVLPNFLIIGAHKAGTTSMYAYLKAHPQIFMPEIKETRFFAFNHNNPDHIKKVPKIFPITTLEEYCELFRSVSNEKAIGEASPEYLNSEHAANKIYEYIPGAKLIISLRNPVDRAYSSFIMQQRADGKSLASLSDYNFTEEMAGKGQYYPKLKMYFDLFKKEQIKVILFEDMVADIKSTINGLYRFLDVSENFSPDFSTRYNRGYIPKYKSIYKVSKNKGLKNFLKSFLPNTALEKLKGIKDSNMQNVPKLTKEQRIESIKLVMNDINKVEDLLQRDLSVWYNF